MKILDLNHFNEKMKIVPLSNEDFDKISPDIYNYYPETKEELQSIINERIEKEGNECDLNDIDTSRITDMSGLFLMSSFNGDISKWDVSNVTDMSRMFGGAESFNGDVSKWNVSNVTNMSVMFNCAESFNQDISRWDVSKVTNMRYMFAYAESFNQDISKWKVSYVTNKYCMFIGCPLKNNPPSWYRK